MSMYKSKQKRPGITFPAERLFRKKESMAEAGGYRAVIDWIRKEISAGHLKTGDRLPSEKELCDQFGLSRQTVRHATGELEKEGVLTRVRGSGTYLGSPGPAPRQAENKNIAVVSTYVDSYIFPPTIRGIESVLARAGYSVQLSFTDDLVTRERMILESLLEKDNIDGLIIEPSKSALPNPNLELYRRILKRNIPILFFTSAGTKQGTAPADHAAGFKKR